MALGPGIRRRLGRFEVAAAQAYRSFFINLDDLAVTLASLTEAKRILEIGCGDGLFAQRLCEVFPEAEYVGIDVADNPGRLFRGDRSRVSFHTTAVSDFLAESLDRFDLVAIVDVLHHVPPAQRVQVLGDAGRLVSANGTIAIKECERSRHPGYLSIYFADRYFSGDKTVRFADRDELRHLMAQALPGFAVACEARVPSLRANLLYTLRRGDLAHD
ncbi:MAG TPA: class I SAM-dependent methyltransferase [Actinophytocola sp.]|uniref:class I SAM-dependent methyltransferase n=1 Tax=Actinophytocola sp. TaxID=1872138 RepID=UPI002DBF8AB9|nr:class I SAM-dependent methyltransferase [Actinophytocola sp.]HEU5473350.1 class I SAM-dependent methyltransferase [Actinophytocola sp.]